MTVATDEGRWVVPGRRAIWVPPNHRHRIEMHGHVFLKTLYLQSNPCGFNRCTVVNISPLLHELIQLIADRGILASDNSEDGTTIRFLMFRLSHLAPVPLSISMPLDARALRFAELVLANPNRSQSLDSLAKRSGASLRTLQRVFPKETGLSLSRWRNQVCMLAAIELLGRSESVTQVAISLGFESLSAFIYAFKQCFGEPPGKYRSSQRNFDST